MHAARCRLLGAVVTGLQRCCLVYYYRRNGSTRVQAYTAGEGSLGLQDSVLLVGGHCHLVSVLVSAAISDCAVQGCLRLDENCQAYHRETAYGCLCKCCWPCNVCFVVYRLPYSLTGSACTILHFSWACQGADRMLSRLAKKFLMSNALGVFAGSCVCCVSCLGSLCVE